MLSDIPQAAEAQMRRLHTLLPHRRLLPAILLFLLAPPTPAQQPEPPTLDQLLLHLEANLRHYETEVPSFLADEHVVSQMFPSRTNADTVTDSTFRLKRTVDTNNVPTLAESRDIKTINGRPATADSISGPTLLSGAFSGGLGLVSLEQKGCMKYALAPVKPSRRPAPYVIEFATRINPENPLKCLLQEEGSGRVLIDPATLQISRLELTAPQHTIRRAEFSDTGEVTHTLLGKWAVSIDYTPIQLDTRTFWMPSTIVSKMTSGTTAMNTVVWTFQARYTNYHKLEVTSRIVP